MAACLNIIMTRIFTFGCSFTNYYWHTYADLLAEAYSDQFNQHISQEIYQNWGHPGLGNRAIAERVAECHMRNKITDKDLVIVQWSGHLRHDFLKFSKDNLGLSWQTKGSVFADSNSHLYDNKWTKNFFDEKGFFVNTLNSIVLVQQLLKSIGCKWLMTSMSDLRYVDFESDEISSNKLFYESHPELTPYTKIWKDYSEHWLTPMMDFKEDNADLDWWFNIVDNSCKTTEIYKGKPFDVYKTKDNMWLEGHLTPMQHLYYLEEILKQFDMKAEIPDRVIQLMNWYDSAKKEANNDFIKLNINIQDTWFPFKIVQGL
jgi:hypothetical protein